MDVFVSLRRWGRGDVTAISGDWAVSGEVAWIGSGGGISRVFPRPGYQNLARCLRIPCDLYQMSALSQILIRRLHSSRWPGPANWRHKLECSCLGGFLRLLNASRTKAGKRTLPFLNPLIYPLNKTKCFRNITSGTNGAFKAGLGYNMVTGLGVPDVKSLMNNLLQTK